MENSKPTSVEPDRRTRTADMTALLGAFCLFLSTIEYMIPKPLPFMRLGIANLPILLAIDILPLPWFLILAVVKAVGMSLVSGSLFSYVALFSFAGTIAAALVMRYARKLGKTAISAIGISVLGAAASNAVQILLATVMVFGKAAVLIAPPFLGMGLMTGLFLGIFAERFMRSSVWLSAAMGRHPSDEATGVNHDDVPLTSARGKPRKNHVQQDAKRKSKQTARSVRRQQYERLFDPAFLAAAGLAVSIAFILQKSTIVRAAMCCAFLLVSFVSGKRFSLFATIVTMLGIAIANLVVPMGKIIGYVGPFPITLTALTEGIDKALLFEGLIFLSRISIVPSLRFPGTLGKTLSSAFVYYDRIIEYKGELHPSSIVRDADRLMLRVWESPIEPAGMPDTGTKADHGTVAGAVILSVAIAVAYALLFI